MIWQTVCTSWITDVKAAEKTKMFLYVHRNSQIKVTANLEGFSFHTFFIYSPTALTSMLFEEFES